MAVILDHAHHNPYHIPDASELEGKPVSLNPNNLFKTDQTQPGDDDTTEELEAVSRAPHADS